VELKKKLLFNMDSKFYVSLEVARLLKEKGYNEETIYYYNSAGKLYLGNGHFNYNAYAVNLSAPSKSEVIDWLDTKEIVIEISSVRNRKWRFSIYKNGWFQIDSWIHDRLDFSTRLEAEEAAIFKALKLLNRKEE
jgi:hypothetical protein